jgi:hypothetical protein
MERDHLEDLRVDERIFGTALDRDRWRVLVNAVMNILVP